MALLRVGPLIKQIFALEIFFSEALKFQQIIKVRVICLLVELK